MTTNVPQLLGKDLGEDGLKFIETAGAAAYDGLPVDEQGIVDDLLTHMCGLSAAIEGATDGTQCLTTTQAGDIMGMVPQRFALAYAGLVMRKAANTPEPVTVTAIREFANAPEPEPKKPFQGLYPGVPDEPPASTNPAPGQTVDMDCGAVAYKIVTLLISDMQKEANRLGTLGWRLAGQSVTVINEVPAMTATFMRALESGTSRRDDEGHGKDEAAGDPATDQRGADDDAAGTSSSGRGGRDDRISLPVVR